MKTSDMKAQRLALRRGEARDMPFIYRLERLYMQDLESEQLQAWQNGVEHHLKQWLDDIPRTSIALFGDDQAGYIFWEEHGNRAVVASVNVAFQYRRRGIGLILLRRFEEEAREAGLYVAQVGFVRHNPARILYGRLGYQKISEEGNYDIMIKRI